MRDVADAEVVMPKLDHADEVEDVTERLSDEIDLATPREAVQTRVRRHFLGFRNTTLPYHIGMMAG
jgi:hypothetical protein